jgi:hypothetical protein
MEGSVRGGAEAMRSILLAIKANIEEERVASYEAYKNDQGYSSMVR